METRANSTVLGATQDGPRPGDFPIGSAESRAAARALAQQSQSAFDRLSQRDKDCYDMQHLALYLTYRGGEFELHDTPEYKRGWEIRDALYPIKPAHLDPEMKLGTYASGIFKMVYGRQPKPGDTLERDLLMQWESESSAHLFGKLGEAWRRLFPNRMFPIKHEEGRYYVIQRVGGWELLRSWDPETVWAEIVERALVYELEQQPDGDGEKNMLGHTPERDKAMNEIRRTSKEKAPSVAAVVFVEDPSGKRHARCS